LIHLSDDRRQVDAKGRFLRLGQPSPWAVIRSVRDTRCLRRPVLALLVVLLVGVAGCTSESSPPSRAELHGEPESSNGTPLRRLPPLATNPPSAFLSWQEGTTPTLQKGYLYRSEWPSGQRAAENNRRIAWPDPQTAKGPIELHFAVATTPSLLTIEGFSSIVSQRARPSGESKTILDCWPKADPSPACQPTVAENEVIFQLEIRPGLEGLVVFAGWPYNPRIGALDSATASYLFRIAAHQPAVQR
jgi:hypothetical protein